MLREIHPEVKEREEAWSKGWSEKSVMGKWLKLEAEADACLNGSFTEWRYPLAHPSSWTSLKSAFSSFKNLSLTHKTQWYKLRYRRAGRGQAVSFSSGTSFSHRCNLCFLLSNFLQTTFSPSSGMLLPNYLWQTQHFNPQVISADDTAENPYLDIAHALKALCKQAGRAGEATAQGPWWAIRTCLGTELWRVPEFLAKKLIILFVM